MDTTKKLLTWGEICEDISLASVRSYRSCRVNVKPDRVRVELDMPIEVFGDFRKNVEAPDALRRRREEDSFKEEKNVVLTFKYKQS